MNIEQLESYNLGDAVKFHDTLNPLLWDKREHLRPEIREHLLKIAADFGEFLGVNDSMLKDITISGSNAAYNYTVNSDIDLHLVIELPSDSDIYRELFDAKKTIYNSEHNITVKGIPVELYAQATDQAHYSQGIYSVLNQAWVEIPRRKKATINDVSVQSKFEDFERRAQEAIKGNSLDQINQLLEKIRNMRRAGLETHGEFGVENLTFKLLRNSGTIGKLRDVRKQIRDQALSLKERNLKEAIIVQYGFGSDFLDEVGVTPDGVSASTCMFANEELVPTANSKEEIVQDFVNFCADQLGLEREPDLRIRRDPEWSKRARTFGRYNPGTNQLEVSLSNRHVMDILRTVAHELTHQHQHEREAVPDHAGETGSEWENEANARAGILMRDYGQANPHLFDAADELDEGWKNWAAAGLATAAMAGSPDVQGQSIQQGLGAVQNIGTAMNTFKGVDWNAMLRSEAGTALYNFILANGGNPNSQNQSTLYQWQKQMQQDQSAQSRQAAQSPELTQQAAPASPTTSMYGDILKQQQARASTNESSGYIPTAAQADDPRFEMALTADVRPGATGKNANKLLLNTDAQGHPQELRADGVVQRMMAEYLEFKK